MATGSEDRGTQSETKESATPEHGTEALCAQIAGPYLAGGGGRGQLPLGYRVGYRCPSGIVSGLRPSGGIYIRHDTLGLPQKGGSNP